MTRILARKDPRTFKTQPLHVEADSQRLLYQPVGAPLNFRQMLERRRPLEIGNPQCFAVELANLGVSVRLTLDWQGRDYWLLVRQQRADRGDCVLKLISGYVPSHELHLPLHTALQEVAEECLVETPKGWLGGRFGEHWLAQPYHEALAYHEAAHFKVSPLCGAARAIRNDRLPLLERPQAYVHLPTASLQLIYELRLELPAHLPAPSLYHVDERLEEQQLIARLERQSPNLYLQPVDNPRGELFTLQQGELCPVCTDDLWLSEGFAGQDGWLVREERISWDDWLGRQRCAA
ncbi:MAG TPA: metal ABC transporter ATPase [Pseudomonas sp.]|nr:metal ABC transporter ATPase [Pseudomonas sp.]